MATTSGDVERLATGQAKEKPKPSMGPLPRLYEVVVRGLSVSARREPVGSRSDRLGSVLFGGIGGFVDEGLRLRRELNGFRDEWEAARSDFRVTAPNVLHVTLIVLAVAGLWAVGLALAGAFSWLLLRGSDAPAAAAIFVGFAGSALLAGVVSGHPTETPDASAPSQQDTSARRIERDQPKPVLAPSRPRAMIGRSFKTVGRWFKRVGRSITADRTSAAVAVAILLWAIVAGLTK
jgi:hypothetical protein